MWGKNKTCRDVNGRHGFPSSARRLRSDHGGNHLPPSGSSDAAAELYLAGLRYRAALSQAHRLSRFLGSQPRRPALSRACGASRADLAHRVQLRPRRAEAALATRSADIPKPVIPGLDPGIHAVMSRCVDALTDWIAGSSPAMTRWVGLRGGAPEHLERALHRYPMIGVELLVVGVAMMRKMDVAEGRVTAVPDRRSASRFALFSANIAEAKTAKITPFPCPFRVVRCQFRCQLFLSGQEQIGVSEMLRALWKIEKNTR